MTQIDIKQQKYCEFINKYAGTNISSYSDLRDGYALNVLGEHVSKIYTTNIIQKPDTKNKDKCLKNIQSGLDHFSLKNLKFNCSANDVYDQNLSNIDDLIEAVMEFANSNNLQKN